MCINIVIFEITTSIKNTTLQMATKLKRLKDNKHVDRIDARSHFHIAF